MNCRTNEKEESGFKVDQLESIAISFHAFYITFISRKMVRYFVTLIRQEKKMETSFFLNRIYVSSRK